MNNYIYYFGYGSLVNLASITTPFVETFKVSLHGWRRAFVIGKNGKTFLSIIPCQKSKIDGLIICDHKNSLPALNKREIAYEKQNLLPNEIEWYEKKPNIKNCFTYICQQTNEQATHKILRSYLDVVMQGYLQQFGKQGLQRFIATTDNFNSQIIEDRKNPLYPRAVCLSKEEIELFNSIYEE